MEGIGKIVSEIIAELKEKVSLPLDVIKEVVIKAADEQLTEAKKPSGIVILHRLKLRVKIKEGSPIPEHKLEALKKLIKKAALRKLKKIEEEELQKTKKGKKSVSGKK